MKQSIAKALLDISAVGFSPDSPITFKSGIRSPVYVDNRQLIYHPPAWHSVIDGFKSHIELQDLQYDLIAGVADGGVPHSSALAFILHKPSVFIRKEAKEHGKGRQIEGGDVSGKRVLLVEDHVTTGGSSLMAVGALQNAEATVTDVLSIISYGFPEAVSSFKDANLTLHTLTDFDNLLNMALKRGDIRESQLAVIHDWFSNPRSWGREYA